MDLVFSPNVPNTSSFLIIELRNIQTLKSREIHIFSLVVGNYLDSLGVLFCKCSSVSLFDALSVAGSAGVEGLFRAQGTRHRSQV